MHYFFVVSFVSDSVIFFIFPVSAYQHGVLIAYEDHGGGMSAYSKLHKRFLAITHLFKPPDHTKGTVSSDKGLHVRIYKFYILVNKKFTFCKTSRGFSLCYFVLPEEFTVNIYTMYIYICIYIYIYIYFKGASLKTLANSVNYSILTAVSVIIKEYPKAIVPKLNSFLKAN